MEVNGLLNSPIPFIMMGIYLAVVVFLSCRVMVRNKIRRKNRSQTFEDFYTGNKSMPAVVVGLVTIVTFYSGTTFTGRVGFFYNYGVVALTTVFSSSAAGVIMFFLSEKVWPISKKYHCSTLADILELRYQSRYVKLVCALIIVSFNTIWLITEIRTLGIIVNIASGGVVSSQLGSAIAFAIIMAYVCTGGIRSVAAVDSFSSGLMLAGSVVTVVYIVRTFYQGNVGAMFAAGMHGTEALWTVAKDAEFGYSYWISSVLVSTIVMLVYPSNYMSICMGENVRAVKKASLAASMSGIWLMIYGVIAAAALGLGSHGIMIHNPEASLLEMVSYSGNGFMLGLVTTFVLAASLGTLDSTLISLSGILSNDILVNGKNIRNQVPCIGSGAEGGSTGAGNEGVGLTRAMILLLGIVALVLSMKQLPLLVLLVNYASNGLLQLVPAVLGGLYWKKATAAGAITSMLSGVGTLLILDLIKRHVYLNDAGFLGGYFLGIPSLAVGVLVFVAVSCLTCREGRGLFLGE